jgi:hypothetical protein
MTGRPRGQVDERNERIRQAIATGGKYSAVAAEFKLSESQVAFICTSAGVRSVRAEKYRSCWQHRLKDQTT